jgi:transposase
MVMGRPLVITWAAAETPDALYARYRKAGEARIARRLRALWLVRTGHSLRQTAGLVDVDERTVGVWLRWYRDGGLAAVTGHRLAGKGQPCRLSGDQVAALTAQLSSGAVYTAQDARTWVAEQFQVRYQPKGMYSLLHRLQARPKVPRPHNPKSTPEQQEAWKKGGSPTPSAPPASPSRRG